MLLTSLLEEFVFNCECRRLSPKTTRNYQKQIQYLLNYLHEEHGVLEVEKVVPKMIKAYLLLKERSSNRPAYINDLLKAFKCFFKYLHVEGYTAQLITERIHNVKQPKVIIQTFTKKNIADMINACNGVDFLSLRNKAIICMLFDTGIRLNELISLSCDQIKPDYLLIHGKGNKERVVPKSPYLGKTLLKYNAVREGYFAHKAVPYANYFLSKNGKPLTHEGVLHMLKQVGVQARVSNDIRVSPHTCRHTFAQMQLMNGLDIYTLARVMGHESIAITQRYLEGIRDADVVANSVKTSPLMNL